MCNHNWNCGVQRTAGGFGAVLGNASGHKGERSPDAGGTSNKYRNMNCCTAYNTKNVL